MTYSARSPNSRSSDEEERDRPLVGVLLPLDGNSTALPNRNLPSELSTRVGP